MHALRRAAPSWLQHRRGRLVPRGALLSSTGGPDEPEAELHPYWADVERRVVGRKPRTSGPSGRTPPRKSEIDYWLDAGLYDEAGQRPGVVAPATSGVARIVTTAVSCRATFAAAYHQELVPAMQQVPGFQRAMLLQDTGSDVVRSITVWDDEAVLNGVASNARYMEAMASVATLMQGEPEVTDTELAVHAEARMSDKSKSPS